MLGLVAVCGGQPLTQGQTFARAKLRRHHFTADTKLSRDLLDHSVR